MRIAVGAITRRRPRMFSALLASFAAMERPAGAQVLFVLAENDATQTIGPQVDAFRAAVREPVLLGLETRPGIPFARNRVLDMALEAGADILTFVDDDEVVTRDWLVRLVAGMEARALDLAGGPVRLVETAEPLTRMNRAVLAHLLTRARKRHRTREAAVARGTDHACNIYTNNWALRLATQRRLALRFDESLAESGGSDTRFSLDMKSAGARNGWVADAWVEEPTPAKRLTLGYHFRRARDQATNAVVLNRKGPARALREAATRALEAAVIGVAIPVTGRRGLARVSHKLGMATGCLGAALGRRSRHYARAAERDHAEIRG